MGRKQKIKERKKVEESRNISREIRERDKGTLYYIIYIGLIILLLYPPYFRGMFFDKEFLPTHMYSGALFLLYIFYKTKVLKEKQFFKSPMDYAAIALVGAYFLSIFVAVNIRSAVGEFLKYINYFIAFYMVSDFARTEKDMRIILRTMVISALGVAFIGIGAAAGTFTYNGAFVGGRINSTIQYPNTLAAYLTAAFMISVTLWATAERRWQRGILSFINYTLFLCFIFTLSRGAWLLFPVFFLILVAGMPSQYRMKILGYSIETFIAAVLASPGFGSAISAAQGNRTWMWYLAGAVVSAAVFYIFEKISERFALHIKPKVILAIFTVLIVLGGVGGYIALTTEAPLTLSHGENEPESWKTSWYPITDVKPDTEYTLKFTVSTKPGEKENEWGGAVLVNSIDENNDSVLILNNYIDKEVTDEAREVTFKTRPDTASIKIGFSNRFTNTTATFHNAQFYESKDTSLPKRIILNYKYIPQVISQRITSISTEDFSVSGRYSYYRDALKIIKEHPIIGTGGGGWKSMYFAYQSYRYFTTEVHNFFLQLWVETGTVGLLALITLWIITMLSGYKTLRSDNSSSIKTLTWGALSGAIALGGHSAMDFNLSLGSIALYLWQLFGVMRFFGVLSSLRYKTREVSTHWAVWPLSGLSCILIITSLFLYQGYTYGQQAVEAVQQQDLLKAKDYFEKAAKYDPLTASYKADLAQLDYFVVRQSENDTLLKKSESMRLEAVNLDPFNARLRTQLAAYYLEQGKLEEGISELEKATEINPFNVENWENLADAYQKAAIIYITQDQKDKALDLTSKSQKMFSKISQYNRKAPKNAREKLEVTSDLMLYIYKSKLLAENIDDDNYHKELDKLVFASDFTVDADNDGVPDLWRISYSPKGLLEVNIEKEAVQIINKGEGPSYFNLKKDITLLPKEPYTVNLFIGGKNSENNPILNVLSRKSQNLQHQLKNIVLSRELTKISSIFAITEDIEDGPQWLRMDILGNMEDVVIVKGVEVWLGHIER